MFNHFDNSISKNKNKCTCVYMYIHYYYTIYTCVHGFCCEDSVYIYYTQSVKEITNL